MDYKNKKVLVIGMAKSGVSSAALLCRLGADVTIYDVKKREDLPKDLLHELDGFSYRDMLGQDPMDKIPEMDILVLSPGVPLGLPFIRRAYELGKQVIAEIELGFAVSKADFIAITGTNGKYLKMPVFQRMCWAILGCQSRKRRCRRHQETW